MWVYYNMNNLINLIEKYNLTHEFDIIDNERSRLELYTEDIENFPQIPKELFDEIQKDYEVISLSPEIKDIDDETYAALVFYLRR